MRATPSGATAVQPPPRSRRLCCRCRAARPPAGEASTMRACARASASPMAVPCDSGAPSRAPTSTSTFLGAWPEHSWLGATVRHANPPHGPLGDSLEHTRLHRTAVPATAHGRSPVPDPPALMPSCEDLRQPPPWLTPAFEFAMSLTAASWRLRPPLVRGRGQGHGRRWRGSPEELPRAGLQCLRELKHDGQRELGMKRCWRPTMFL